mgnify:CR=1 FL=1
MASRRANLSKIHAPNGSVVRKTGAGKLSTDAVGQNLADTFGFLGDGAEIDEIVILFVVHEILSIRFRSLQNAALRMLVRLSLISDAIRPRIWKRFRAVRPDNVELLAGVGSLLLRNQCERSSQ